MDIKRFGKDFEELNPVLDVLVDASRGICVGDLAFASYEDYYSTGVLGALTSGGVLAASSEVQLYASKIGDPGGQGWNSTVIHNYGLTNNQDGAALSVNSVYVAVRTGFRVYVTTDTSTVDLMCHQNADDLCRLLELAYWSYNVGETIENRIGSLMDWPTGAGISLGGIVGSSAFGTLSATEYKNSASQGLQNAGHAMRYLPIPLVLQPEVQVDIRVKTGHAITFKRNTAATSTAAAIPGLVSSATNGIIVKQVMRGIKLKLPT